MSLLDLEVFVRECLATFDAGIDLTPGSPADVRIVQRLLRRLGSDPFTVDVGTFLHERIRQEFPDAATNEGDAITDLLIKPAMVLWGPIVREIRRVQSQLSLRDPENLTVDEAEALGANLFAVRNRGDVARGIARLYFARPQQLSISPANFFVSQTGLRFFPTDVQSISASEMALNAEGSLFYFDISVIAQDPGAQYNCDEGQLVSVANVPSAVRVTNKARFRLGAPAETAAEFISRLERELTERSLVTERGIAAKIHGTFSELTGLGVVGFGDPDMQRDVIAGGGLGRLLAGGLHLAVIADGENRALSRRVRVTEPVDFAALMGPVGAAPSGFAVTIFDAFSALPLVRDLTVKAIVDGQTLDLQEQVLRVGLVDRSWTLRKQELTLSQIPGGILFPDRPDGTLSVPPDRIHVGGATDILVRGADFDAATLLISSVVDDTPALSGRALRIVDASHVALKDLVLGTNYSPGDATHILLENSVGLTLQVLDPPSAGTFRITAVTQASGSSPSFAIAPAIITSPAALRWRLLDELDVDLVEPKETRITGTDLATIQGEDLFDTASGTDFGAYGVAPGDVLRIFTGPVAGDYRVRQVLLPLFRRVQVDRPFAATASSLQFAVFRPAADKGLELPLVRIRRIDLLDSSAQSIGTTIPYARPVDVQTRAFANVAHGIKADFPDGLLGIVSPSFATGTVDVSGLSLKIRWGGFSGFNVTFANAGPAALASIVEQINRACELASGASGLATILSGNRVGLVPIAPGLLVESGTAMAVLFGQDASYAAKDIRSERAFPSFANLRPALDATFDVAQMVNGRQIGCHGTLTLTAGGALRSTYDFSPEAGVHVQVGSRSVGSARVYFLEPTSVEFPKTALFTVQMPDGATLRYLPDPTRTYQRVPALPSGIKPRDGVTVADGNVLTTSTVDFVAKGIAAGDVLAIDFVPIVGGAALPDPVPGLHGKTLVLNIRGGLDKTIVCVHDDANIGPGDVTRQGVVDQINRAVGQSIARITGANKLELEADADMVVRAAGGSANAILGFPSGAVSDASNASPHKGPYAITKVSPSQLTVDGAFRQSAPSTVTRQQFRVLRSGLQRICATDMAKQMGAAGLYYIDVDLISEGTGDNYNVEADLPMTVQGYKADGYSLTTADPHLAFSPVEQPRLRLSPSILEQGVSDDPEGATQLSGQHIQITYDRSALTQNVERFATSESERVVNASVLVRHLTPHFVRFDVTYTGGSQENVVLADLRAYVQNLRSEDAMVVSEIEKIILNRGAVSVENPIDLIAVIHNVDRSITVQRSRDRIAAGRLAAFVPDGLRVRRRA